MEASSSGSRYRIGRCSALEQVRLSRPRPDDGLGPPSRRAAPDRHGECELDPMPCLSISSATVLREIQRRNTSGVAVTSTIPFWRSGEAAPNCSNSAGWREASSISIRRICARADRASFAAGSTDIAWVPCCAEGYRACRSRVCTPGLQQRRPSNNTRRSQSTADFVEMQPYPGPSGYRAAYCRTTSSASTPAPAAAPRRSVRGSS